MAKHEHCSTCDQRLEVTRIPAFEGEDGEYSIRLLDFPVLACPANHERWYLYDDFGPDLIESVYYKNKSSLTERKGFLRQRDYCARCHHSMEGLEEAKQTFEIPVQMKSGHHFTLRVSGPAITCSSCGTVQIQNVQQRTSVIAEALANALKAAAIKPR